MTPGVAAVLNGAGTGGERMDDEKAAGNDAEKVGKDAAALLAEREVVVTKDAGVGVLVLLRPTGTEDYYGKSVVNRSILNTWASEGIGVLSNVGPAAFGMFGGIDVCSAVLHQVPGIMRLVISSRRRCPRRHGGTVAEVARTQPY